MIPRVLLLDLGKVLVDFDHLDTCRALAIEVGLEPGEVHRRLFASGLEADFDRGRVDEARFAAEAVRRLGATGLPPGRVLSAWAGIFSRDEPNLAALPALSREFRLVLASNTNITHYRRCRELAPELGLCHATALSFELGERKPDAAYWEAALYLAEAGPEECLLVDDRPENVEGARLAGIPAVRHRPGDPLTVTLAGTVSVGRLPVGRGAR